MPSLHDKPQLAWVETVTFLNGLRLAARYSSYNGIILFLRLLEASSSANFAHKRVISDLNLWGCTHKKTIKIIDVNLHSSVHKPPQKITETRGKNFLQKFIGCRDEPIKSTETRQG